MRKTKFQINRKFFIQEKIEPANYDKAHSYLDLLENKPQINADERRFVNLNIKRFSEVYPANDLIISPQRSQRPSMPVNMYKMAAASRLRLFNTAKLKKLAVE